MSGSPVAVSFAIALAAAVTTGLGAHWSSRGVAAATQSVSHTREVQAVLEEVLSLLKDAETGQRGFLLTGDPAYLGPYQAARGELPRRLDALQGLTADNPAQQERLQRLRTSAAARLQLSERAVDDMHAGRRDAAVALVASGRGKQVMDEAREQIAAMKGEEERLLGLRLREVEVARLRSGATAGITTGLLLALITTIYASSQRASARIRAALDTSEQARRELEFVRSALDQAAIVAVSDAQGRLLDVNEAFVRTSGYPREQLLAGGHKAVSTEFHRDFYDTMKAGRTWRGELRSHARDGHAFWTDTTVVPLLAPDARPERFIAIHYDITDRKRAELALRDSESRYRTLAEALPDLLWTATPALVPTYFNRQWKAFTGLQVDTLQFDDWLQLIHPDDRQGFVDAIEPAVARGEAHEAQFRLRRHDGAWRHVVARATPRRDEAGGVLQWVGTVTDIEDRWLAERALHQSQRLVQDIVDGASALVFAKDLQGRYFLTNRAWRELAGISPDQAEGITDAQVFGAVTARRLAQSDQEVVGRGEPLLVEETTVLRGHPVTYLSSKFPLRDAGGAVYAVCGVSTDITELKVAREEVQRLNAELEARVRERTRQLSEANEQLEAYSDTVSHDLRAPLRGLQGLAQAVLEDSADRLDAQGRDYLERIVSAARRMEALIEDLLEYGRLSREQMQLRDTSLDLALAEALAQLAPDIARRHADVQVQKPLPPVHGHPTALRQLVANLLGNALTYVAPGQTPQVRVWSERERGRVRTFVRDHGIGIRPEHQERIFRVFERLHGQEAYPGTGVGLAIVRKACERMDGSCGVDSRPGEGSTFWFELQAAGLQPALADTPVLSGGAP